MMKYILTEKPKKPTIIQGLPSFGLVSTITIKYLLDHLETKEIGYIESENLLPLTAIHKGKIVNPITLYYNKKHNIILVQAITELTGAEWQLAETMVALGKELKAKEFLIIEAMPPHDKDKINIYGYSTSKKMKNLMPLQEGIVMGATAALLLKSKETPVSCIFAEAHSQLPDSEAAAKVVDAINAYLGMKVDYKPLLEAAKKFEMNLKQVIDRTRQNMAVQPTQQKRDTTSYIG